MKYKRLTKTIITKFFQPRKADSNKGDHGHALLIAGNKGRMGAAVIAARACVRSGTGLLTVIVPQEERLILQVALPEAMLSMREEEHDLKNVTALGIGPAIGLDDAAAATLKKILTEYHIPLLLDADALTLLSKDKSLFEKIPAGTVITPHPKEFDRLFGEHKSENARREKAIQVANEKNIILVLKGHKTLITNGSLSYLNATGNAGLAKGGSGDALSGIITALLAQRYEPLHAVCIAVYIHGFAADIAMKDQSPESMLISDVIECLGKAFKKINQ